MIKRIASREILETTRDGRFRISAAIVLGLLAISLAMGWKHYEDVRKQHEAAQRATRQNWLDQGVKNPHSAAHYGVYAFKPKSPLSLVDQGTDAYTGVAVWLEAHKQDEFRYKPAQDANTLARFGEFSAAGVLQILVPLLIVLMSFSAFAGEREQGTLRQLLAGGIDRRKLALGKALGQAGGLGILLVPASLLGAGALVTAGEPGAFSGTAARIALMALAYLLYYTAILGICLAVSARARTPRTALIVLLACWIGNCLIAPRATTDLVRYLYPTPSAFTFAQDVEHGLEKGLSGNSSPAQRRAKLKQDVMRQYGVSDIKDLPVAYAGLSLQRGEEDGYKVFDNYYHRLWDTFEQQNRARQLSGFAMPMLAAGAVSRGLAGTDFAQHRHFAEAAENYRREYIKLINKDIAKNALGKPVYVRGGDLWSTIPPFSYSAPDTTWVVSHIRASLLALLLWAIVGCVAACWSVLRLRSDS